MTTVDLGANGAITIPEAVLEESHIKPGTPLVAIADEGRIVLWDRERFRNQVETPAWKLLDRFREVTARDPEAPFVASVPVGEYAALSAEEEQALWDRLEATAVRETPRVERDIPAHFRPARQKRA